MAPAAVPFGVAEIDDALPWNGLPCGGLHEVSGGESDGAAFAFVAALLARAEGLVLWCRRGRSAGEVGVPYGPGLAEFGLAPERLILAEAKKPAELLLAMEEGLRCRSVAAVLGEGVAPDLTASRRLQLAAESGGTLGIATPPAGKKPQSSAALTRWRVTALPSFPEGGGPGPPRWHAELLRCRGGSTGEWLLEWDDEALRFAVVSPLADRPLAAAAG